MSTREFCISVKTDSRDFKKLVKEIEKLNKRYSDDIGPICGLFAALKAKSALSFSPVLFGEQTETKSLPAKEELVYVWGEKGYVDSIYRKFKGFEVGSGLDRFLHGILDEDNQFKSGSAQNEHFLYSEISDNKIVVPFSAQTIEKNINTDEIQDVLIVNEAKTFAEQVDNVLNGADTSNSHLEVLRETPPLLRVLGVPNLPILMSAGHLKTVSADSGAGSANYHGLGADIIKRLPELISDPVMIMDSISPNEKAKNSVVIVTETVDKENRPVIGAIKLDGVGRRDSQIISANILTSAYGKDRFKSFIERNIAKGAILYIDKEKSQDLSVNLGIQFPDVMASLSFNTIIRKTNAFVNSADENNQKKAEAEAEQKRKQLIINLFAGPSAGKTTAALELTAALKKKGYNVEYVSEYAKELVLENKTELLKNQVHVTDEQFHRLDRLRNSDIEIIVTDSPVLLGKVYGEGKISREYGEKILTYHNSFKNFNLFVNRGETFQTEGRVHNLEQSREIDNKIIAMLREGKIFYGNYNHDEIEKTVERISKTLDRLNGRNEEITEKNGDSMRAATNNETAQTTRERVQQIRDDMVKTLLEHIEKNPTDWQSGWSKIAAGAPYNGKTNTAYRGMNALYLACLGFNRGYKDTRWVTFNQAKELGASVKKGEKSSPVIFFEFYDRATKKAFDSRTVKDMTEEEKTAYIKENVYAVMKYSSVFNAEQCHNFPERKEIAMSEEERANQNVKIETIIANSAAPVFYDGGSRAYYSPGTDSIHLPPIKAFDTMQNYYATALHEIAHSTGHESRLNRDLAGGFGSESYAKEELRAELACVFMQMEQGIQVNGKHITNHAAYLNSWLEAAKRDTSVFFKAAADAQKIADYVADNYLQAADSAVIEEENVAQEQNEEQPERNPMAEYLRAESEKRAEEIRTIERLRADSLGETEQQKLENARALAQRLATETGEPYVTIEWSEHQTLSSYDVMSLSEADKKLAALDAQENKNEGYYKTKLHIDYVIEGEHNSYECCRFDIGSEGGGLVRHIDEFLRNDTFLGAEEREQAETALKYFKVHMDLSSMEDTAISSNLSEQEQFDVQSYVLLARGVVNSAIPFSSYKLPDMVEAEQEESATEAQFLKQTKSGSPVSGIIKAEGAGAYHVAIINNYEQKEVAFPEDYPPGYLISFDYNPSTGDYLTAASGFTTYEEANSYLIKEYGIDIGQSQESITEFRNENAFLSNFYTAPINYNGQLFLNNEAAFQAMKCPLRSSEFSNLTGAQARALGRQVELRSDWNEVKEKIMLEICRAKFLQHADLSAKLLQTGERKLIEGNTWHDTEWGVYNGEGQNKLGKILMEVRAELNGDHEKKLTVEEARNAMLDAQEQRQNHYAVRIENVPYTDPEDGYEGEEPAQVIYTISQHGNVREWKTIPMDDDVFFYLPNHDIMSYEPVEYEELEEIAKNVREPIQTFKDVLRAELETNTDRRRSDGYYDQRVDDILDEHYRTEYGLFKRDIENPKYLSGLLYAEETFRGEKVVSLTQDESGKNIAIIKTISGKYTVADDYNTDDGRNWGKQRTFDDQKTAEEFRDKTYGKGAKLSSYDKLSASTSELVRRYAQVKRENPSEIVFYRIGDFYEILGEDARRAAEALELTLTGREAGLDERVSMAGVPYHAVDEYVSKLAKNGVDVAIADGADIRHIKGNTPQDMAQIPQEKPVETQERKREWLSIELPNGTVGGQYGENTMIKMPKGEFSYYAFYVPTRFLKEADGKTQLRVASDYMFRLNNDGRQVELTGQELKDSFAGKHLDKMYKRVAPSRRYAQGLANLEKNVPAELKAIPTWCCYRTQWNEEKGKKDKFIISPIDGKWTSSKEPGKWVTFDAAMKYARENNCEGVSVLLDKKYGITCIDLDKCILNAETGELTERAAKLVKELNGTYIERSTSGNGLHIFVKDDILKNGQYNMTAIPQYEIAIEGQSEKKFFDEIFKKSNISIFNETKYLINENKYLECDYNGKYLTGFITTGLSYNEVKRISDAINDAGIKATFKAGGKKGDLEVYDDKRIMSLTGDMYSKGNTLTRAGSAATVYLRQELGERRNVASNGAKPHQTGSLNLSDSELIRWIRGSKVGAKFDDLYSGRGVSGDRSDDDGKLAHMLLYFNGGDKEQAFRMMRESGAYRPDKPDSYYRHTIDKMNGEIKEYAKRPNFLADGPGKPKGKGPWNGKKGSQAY